MNDSILLPKIERTEAGLIRVLAPCVGWWDDPPHRGAWVGPGSSIGTIRQLNRRYRLVLPDGAAGRVGGRLPAHHVNAVEFGELLLELSPVATAAREEAGESQTIPGQPPGATLAPEMLAIISPTEGVFYLRATPDAAPFVKAGSRIRLGQPIGLVEVMKTFNQIVYEGPGFPETAEVVEVRVNDGEEVEAGQILVVVR
jgi:biotin carboxyl carrier protein